MFWRKKKDQMSRIDELMRDYKEIKNLIDKLKEKPYGNRRLVISFDLMSNLLKVYYTRENKYGVWSDLDFKEVRIQYNLRLHKEIEKFIENHIQEIAEGAFNKLCSELGALKQEKIDSLNRELDKWKKC